MNYRDVLLGVACGVTTFLFAGAGTIVAIGDRFGDSPGVGILAVGAGLFAGLLAAFLGTIASDRLSGVPARALLAYGVFGVTFLGIAALQYVNVPGADAVFSFPVHLGVSVLVAVLAGVFGQRESPVSLRPSA
jgi:hypothetical protein